MLFWRLGALGFPFDSSFFLFLQYFGYLAMI